MSKGEYRLKPNTEYAANGYQYKTDDLGRITSAEGKLRLEDSVRNNTHQKKAGLEDRQPGDHGGHLIAHIFGGSGMVDNIVPMQGNLVNQGAYKKLENTWKAALELGDEVEVKILPTYSDGSLRPSEFTVYYWINGVLSKKKIKNE